MTSISTIKNEVRSSLVAFAWDQWAQLGVFAPTSRRDRWAVDPEALLLFTLEVARSDARLFDEVLDWLLVNERVVSVQRLRNLCADATDRQLVEAAVSWLAHWKSRGRSRSHPTRDEHQKPKVLFTTPVRINRPDAAFLEAGFLKPDTEPSGKSREPDLDAPIAFAFRMRNFVGVGSRAEVLRHLLTVPAPDVPTQLIAEAAAFAKRNVNQTLAALADARIVNVFESRNERRYYLNKGLWAELLAFDSGSWPIYREWPRLLLVVRKLHRWFEEWDSTDLSDYRRASESRTLMDDLARDVAYAGIFLRSNGPRHGADYWDSFVADVRHILASLDSGAP